MNLEELKNDFASTGAEIHGTPVEIGGTTFMVKPMSEGNRGFLAVIAKVRPSTMVVNDGGEEVPAPQQNMMATMQEHLPEVLATGLVASWEGMELQNGEVVPYSVENARSIFSMHPKLATQVFSEATKIGAESDMELHEDGELLGED